MEGSDYQKKEETEDERTSGRNVAASAAGHPLPGEDAASVEDSVPIYR